MKKINFGLLSLITALLSVAIYPLFSYFEEILEPIMELFHLDPMNLAIISIILAIVSFITEEWRRKKYAIAGLLISLGSLYFSFMLLRAWMSMF